MAIRNDGLGGVDWENQEVFFADDGNDTFTDVIEKTTTQATALLNKAKDRTFTNTNDITKFATTSSTSVQNSTINYSTLFGDYNSYIGHYFTDANRYLWLTYRTSAAYYKLVKIDIHSEALTHEFIGQIAEADAPPSVMVTPPDYSPTWTTFPPPVNVRLTPLAYNGSELLMTRFMFYRVVSQTGSAVHRFYGCHRSRKYDTGGSIITDYEGNCGDMAEGVSDSSFSVWDWHTTAGVSGTTVVFRIFTAARTFDRGGSDTVQDGWMIHCWMRDANGSITRGGNNTLIWEDRVYLNRFLFAHINNQIYYINNWERYRTDTRRSLFRARVWRVAAAGTDVSVIADDQFSRDGLWQSFVFNNGTSLGYCVVVTDDDYFRSSIRARFYNTVTGSTFYTDTASGFNGRKEMEIKYTPTGLEFGFRNRPYGGSWGAWNYRQWKVGASVETISKYSDILSSALTSYTIKDGNYINYSVTTSGIISPKHKKNIIRYDFTFGGNNKYIITIPNVFLNTQNSVDNYSFKLQIDGVDVEFEKWYVLPTPVNTAKIIYESTDCVYAGNARLNSVFLHKRT